MRAVYHKGPSYSDLEVDWIENNEPIDLTGKTITLDVFSFGEPVLFTKTTGFVPAAPVAGVVPLPNLTVTWAGELDALSAGNYVMRLRADGVNEMFGELVLRENAPNFGYCELIDLELGDVSVPPSINLYDYINGAADEINSELGQIYTLPLDLSLAPAWVALKLKKINAKWAAGRFVAGRALPTENGSLNAFATWLLKDATSELGLIMSGTVNLPGLPRVQGSFRASAPRQAFRDASSAVDAFEDRFMRGDIDERWHPGPVPTSPFID